MYAPDIQVAFAIKSDCRRLLPFRVKGYMGVGSNVITIENDRLASNKRRSEFFGSKTVIACKINSDTFFPYPNTIIFAINRNIIEVERVFFAVIPNGSR